MCFVNSMWVYSLTTFNLYRLSWPKASIAFEEEKSNMFCAICRYYSLNIFNPYRLLWPKCGYCNLYTFNLMANKLKECKYSIFYICGAKLEWTIIAKNKKSSISKLICKHYIHKLNPRYSKEKKNKKTPPSFFHIFERKRVGLN